MDTAATVLAILSGAGAVAAASGGMLLTVRRTRTREQQRAEAALHTAEDLLGTEREQRIAAERQLHATTVVLAQHGLEVPET